MSFTRAFKNGGLAELQWQGGDLFAHQATAGSNSRIFRPTPSILRPGREVSFAADIYPRYNIILCVSTFSATAPLTAFAKQFGFRGATLHGLNDIILRTGLFCGL